MAGSTPSLLSRSMRSNLLIFASTLTRSASSSSSSSCLGLYSLSHSRRCIVMLRCCTFSLSASHNNKFSGAQVLVGEVRRQRTLSTKAATSSADKLNEDGVSNSEVRVRFAPSPTGNLHVGGARTALFNYLFAKSKGGKFVLRIEDTDLERSTKESEDAMIYDLHWLGLNWDEGPDKGGSFGPYRQSERTEIYKQYAHKLLLSGHAYRCFCTDEELETMRQIAKEKNLPPKYTGRWARASQEEIEDELRKGTPFTFRFRVPQEGSVTIDDLVRGEVSWSNDTLGDFVILRSNGQPVYNFCVAVDDATMQISHVIRAEEHLPNTLRQVLIYNALKLPMPRFGHVSLILAPDRSKLSKRHGATSVGQFKEMGFLPEAMVNYLALLGWNDGSEDEIFDKEDIVRKFTIDRITKSAAIFDQTKLRWINGQHLRALPADQLYELFGDRWFKAGLLSVPKGPFVNEAAELLKTGLDLVSDADAALADVLSYPLQSALRSDEAKEVVLDNLKEVADAIVSSHESGELLSVLDAGHEGWQKWIKSIGKVLKRKGKRLFMPVRVLLTGKMHGPDIGSTMLLIHKAQSSGAINSSAGFIPITERLEILTELDWNEILGSFSVSSNSIQNVPTLSH